jgi:hypothetical protein
MHRNNFALAVLVIFLGCATGDRAEDAAAGGSAAASTPSGDYARDADMATYELTMDKVNKYYDAQHNVMTRLKDMSPEERERQSLRTAADASVDEMVKNAEASSLISGAARDAGMSVRDYTMTGVATFQAAALEAIVQMQPKVNLDSVAREMKANPRNMRFVQEHRAELTKRQQALDDLVKRMGGS